MMHCAWCLMPSIEKQFWLKPKNTVILNFCIMNWPHARSPANRGLSPPFKTSGLFVPPPWSATLCTSQILHWPCWDYEWGKILLINLSQGKARRRQCVLLGAMFITQIQIAAMGRSFKTRKDERFLPVRWRVPKFRYKLIRKDSLSEASRKYRLRSRWQISISISWTKRFGKMPFLVMQVQLFRLLLALSWCHHFVKEYGTVYMIMTSFLSENLKLCWRFPWIIRCRPFPARTLPPPAEKW